MSSTTAGFSTWSARSSTQLLARASTAATSSSYRSQRYSRSTSLRLPRLSGPVGSSCGAAGAGHPAGAAAAGRTKSPKAKQTPAANSLAQPKMGLNMSRSSGMRSRRPGDKRKSLIHRAQHLAKLIEYFPDLAFAHDQRRGERDGFARDPGHWAPLSLRPS